MKDLIQNYFSTFFPQVDSLIWNVVEIDKDKYSISHAYMDLPFGNFRFLMDRREKLLYDVDIFIYPEKQNQGYGKKLIQTIKEISKNEGIEKIIINNNANSSFYEKLDFEKFKRYPSFKHLKDWRESPIIWQDPVYFSIK